MTDMLHRVAPVLVFLVAITVVAEIADRAGVFDVAGLAAARLARGRVMLLWLLVAALATASTIVLSLDTTAVLLTPVVIAICQQAKLPPWPFVATTVWLANTASLLLPVSNLTNLLAVHHLDHTAYVGLMWRPALVTILVTVGFSWLLHRRMLRGNFALGPPASDHDRIMLWIAGITCLALIPPFALGVAPWILALAALAILLIALAIRERGWLRDLRAPWPTVLAVAALFAVVTYAGGHGLTDLLRGAAGTGDGLPSLLRLSATAAVGGNVVNNLPAYLALDPLAQHAPRIGALLVGVNAGTIVTPWGSVATLLWRDRCRRAGVAIPWPRFIASSAVLAVVGVIAATLAITVG